jgi:hypothetical protein
VLNKKKGIANEILEGKKRRIANGSTGSDFLKIISKRADVDKATLQ